MENGEYTYITIQTDEEGNIDLGEYLPSVAQMHATVLGLYEDTDLVREETIIKDFQNSLHRDWHAVTIALNESGDVVGFGKLAVSESRIADLETAYVKEADRQKGIYTYLVKERIEVAEHMGAALIRVFPDSDAPQVPFLEREGFVYNERTEMFDKPL